MNCLILKILNSQYCHNNELGMGKTKLLPLFVIVSVAAIMGTASIAPAYAAQKVVDDRFDDDITFVTSICGQTVQADVNMKGRFILWDNDKFILKSTNNSKFTDASGKKVARLTDISINVGTIGDAPVVVQFSKVVTCAGTGLVDTFQFGATVHKDGSVNFHG